MEGGSPSAPGALARVRVMLSRSVLAEPAPSAPLAGTSRLHRKAAYTRCLRCAGAPRRPASGSGLSLPFRPDMPSSLTPGSSDIACVQFTRCRRGLRRDPSGSALPTLPQSVSRGTRFSRLHWFANCYGLSGCSPPWTDRTEFPRPPGAFTSRLPAGRSPFPPLDMTTKTTGLPCWGGFYLQASGGSVALPAAGYDYNSNWTPLLAGLSPAGTAASLAAPDLTEFPQPPGAFTSRLPTGRSPFPSLDMTTTALDSSVGGTFTRRNGSSPRCTRSAVPLSTGYSVGSSRNRDQLRRSDPQ